MCAKRNSMSCALCGRSEAPRPATSRYAPATLRAAPGSRTETYVALRMAIDNWRWSGVPFFLRTGKSLKRRASSIVVQFKEVPRILFNRAGNIDANLLTLRIQPDEGFSFDVVSKHPGLDVSLKPVRMNRSY